MTKKTFLCLFCLFISILMNGQSKLSPYTRSFLRNQVATRSASASVGAFVELTAGADTERIMALGVKVYGRVGDIITAEIPVDMLITLSELEEVIRLDIEKPVSLLNDASRQSTGVDKVHQALGLNRPYTGAGVIVGVCDTGIDFNHLAFLDTHGHSRVKCAYLPEDETGTPPPGTDSMNSTFPGSEYTTPEQITALTTDFTGHSHGSHTTCTAAGSYMGNSYYGYATEADLVLCGMPEESLTDVNIANSVLYAFRYAGSVDRPVVMNISLGNRAGAHDGTSFLPRIFDTLSGKGKLISVSAGNDGNKGLHISRKFEDADDVLKTFVSSRSFDGYVDAWSRTEEAIGVQLVVFDILSQAVVYESPLFHPEGEAEMILSSSDIPGLAKYYDGTVLFASEVSPDNGKFHIWCESQLSAMQSSGMGTDYRLGLVYSGSAGSLMDAWIGDNATFTSNSIPGWTVGDTDCSISDLATGDQTITVGAYTTKESYTAINGEQVDFTGRFGMDKPSDYSSYGPDRRGISRPDVLAPGSLVISAVNEYDKKTVVGNYNNLAAEVEVNGRKYHWGNMYGTSMAAPAVTGILALWLEADPDLTPERMKEILRKTSVRDKQVIAVDPERTGAGKIDAYNGLLEVLKGVTGLKAERNINKVLVSALVNGIFRVYAPGETGQITVSLYAPSGVLLYTTTCANEGTVEVDAGKWAGTGVSILRVTGEKTNFRTKVIL